MLGKLKFFRGVYCFQFIIGIIWYYLGGNLEGFKIFFMVWMEFQNNLCVLIKELRSILGIELESEGEEFER